jgi:D-alanine transaminase
MKNYLDEMKLGIRVISREDIRWLRCNIKSIALLPNTLLFQEATEAGAGECLLVRNGFFTEATHSNILFIKDGILQTHPDSNLILPGITKGVVFDICRRIGIEVMEHPVKEIEATLFDECFITGTGSEIMPVIAIDEKQIGNGKPGPLTRRLQQEFFRMTYQELAGERIEVSDW